MKKLKYQVGGTTAFEVPSDDPENPDIEKELKVIILYQHAANTYYKNAYDGSDLAPDCFSSDGNTGTRTEDGEITNCKECPLNVFGSAPDGLGKACKNMRKLYILRSGDAFPMQLTLPATSIEPFRKYLQRLVTKKHKACDVVTKIALKKAESKGGITYAQATFALERLLNDDEQKASRAFAQEMKELIKPSIKLPENNKLETTEDDLPF